MRCALGTQITRPKRSSAVSFRPCADWLNRGLLTQDLLFVGLWHCAFCCLKIPFHHQQRKYIWYLNNMSTGHQNDNCVCQKLAMTLALPYALSCAERTLEPIDFYCRKIVGYHHQQNHWTLTSWSIKLIGIDWRLIDIHYFLFLKDRTPFYATP